MDVLVEMRCRGTGQDGDRKRRLEAFSRHPETPRQLVIELNVDGTDYVSHGDDAAAEFGPQRERLRAVREDAAKKRTRRQVLEQWPADWEKPSESSLLRWLEQAVGLGLVLREGNGRRNTPYCYWLAGIEERCRHGLPYVEDLPELDQLRAAEAVLDKRRRTRLAERKKTARSVDGPVSGCFNDVP